MTMAWGASCSFHSFYRCIKGALGSFLWGLLALLLFSPLRAIPQPYLWQRCVLVGLLVSGISYSTLWVTAEILVYTSLSPQLSLLEQCERLRVAALIFPLDHNIRSHPADLAIASGPRLPLDYVLRIVAEAKRNDPYGYPEFK